MKLAQYIQQVDDKVNQELEKDLSDVTHCSGTEKLAGLFKNAGSGLVRSRKICVSVRFRKRCDNCANQAQVTKPQIQQTGEDITQDTLFLLGARAGVDD